MKKIVFIILSLFAFVAYADNTITSKEYVDGQVSSLQTQIPAKNANTVVTNTGTAGTIGEKKIYDTTAAYGAQSDALVTASAFNSAVQNALESEFVCVEWQGSVHDNAHCLLYEVRGAVQTQTLPSGYTQLEYLESTGTQWINSGVEAKPGTIVKTKFQIIGTPPTQPTDIAFLGAYAADGSGGSKYYLYLFTRETYLNIKMFVAGYRNISIQDHDVHTLNVFSNGDYYLDGVLKGTGIYDYCISSSLSIGIFRARSSSGSMGSIASRFYSVQLDNGTVSRNFVPAQRDSDGELGMYDLVSGTFFTNVGSGKFIAGPVVGSNLYLPSGN